MKRPAPLLLLLVLLTSAHFAPRTARADEPQPLHRYSDDRLPPPGARVNLLLTGAAMFALSYGPAVGASYLWPETPGASDLRIPIAGPWIKLGKTKLCNADPEVENCQDAVRVIGAVFAAIDGLAQAGSLFFLAEGIAMSTASLTAVSQYDSTHTANLRFRPTFTALRKERMPGSLFHKGDFEISAATYSDVNVDLGLGFSGTF